MGALDEMLAAARTEEVVCADCLEHMRTMPSDLVDAVITDPPYGLSFMGADWDSYGGRNGTESIEERRRKGQEYEGSNAVVPRFGNSHGKRPKVDEMVAFQQAMTPIFEEALRVAKPGAHLLCFGGTRTYHRITCAIEEAGWVVKDCIMWVYGSGMPHGQRVDRLMEKRYPNAAPEWEGWNTQLKPAWEPIVVAYKPFKGGVAKNALVNGTGAMNIDACRVPTDEDISTHGDGASEQKSAAVYGSYKGDRPHKSKGQEIGRYPANLVHDGSEEVREQFPDAKGQQGDLRAGIPKRTGVCYGDFPPTKEYAKRDELDTSAARFFYCAKASKKERGEGNTHPTVKPLALMEWLVTLVTREDSLVLDPFCGSGTTLVAAKRLGREFVGIERDPHYCDIARSRLEKEDE